MALPVAFARLLVCAFLVLALAPSAFAGGGPENVLVVVDADSWASLAVANEFVKLRQVPASNMVYLSGLHNFETIGIDDFRAKILGPVFQAIKDRGLEGQIDYVVYSADLPYAVDFGADVKDRKLPGFLTCPGSINGMTYLYKLVLEKDTNYLAMNANCYVRQPSKGGRARRWRPEQQAKLQEATAALQAQKWEEAEKGLADLAKARPDDPELQYNYACCLARLKRPDDAVAALSKAVDAGWVNAFHTMEDDDLESLRPRDDFKKLVEKMKQPPKGAQPPVAFHSATGWSPDGEPSTDAKAPRYMLSVMLAMTSGRGTSVREAIDGLRRSAAADGTAPKGTVYYMKNGDIRSTTREWAFAAAAAKLKEIGVAAQVDEGVLPKDRKDVAGAMIGVAGFDWKGSGSTMLPGAIVEHLTSCGGIMTENGGQTCLSELLRAGAAAASGTVTEPMAIQAKFPLAFIQYDYAGGCTLAEAFYQSLSGPYQLLIVGDPLCRPWAKIPEVTVEGVKAGATVKGTLKLKADAKKAEGVTVGRYELFVDGVRKAEAKPSEAMELDTSKLADGYHELRVVAITADAVQTQGRAVLPVTVANKGREIAITAPAEKRVAWDKTVKIGAKLAKATAIRFLQNGREVGAIAGAEGTVEIDARRLGLGPVRVDVVATLTPDSTVVGRPVDLEVVPETALPAAKGVEFDKLAKGFLLSPEGGEPVAVEPAKDGNILAKGNLKKDQKFELEAYFTVPADEVYQFQAVKGGEVVLAVDSKTIGTAGATWAEMPVSLAAGAHLVRITGTYGNSPWMDLRFGGPGAFRVTADRFRHVATEAEKAPKPPAEAPAAKSAAAPAK